METWDMSEFEGDEVTDYTVQLPSATIPASEAYQRGTLMTLNVQVRVKSVRLEEDRKGNLVRKHILVLEDVSVADMLTPAQRRALIEAAERQAAAEPVADNNTTIPEEEHIEDVLPGQTTIDDQLVEALAEIKDNADEDGEDDNDGPDAQEFLDDVRDRFDERRPITAQLDNDEDDHEHDWMDEEEDYDGLRVEVGF